MGLSRKYWTGASAYAVDANGRPSLVVERDGEPITFATVDVSEDGIEQILFVVNDEKLGPDAIRCHGLSRRPV